MEKFDNLTLNKKEMDTSMAQEYIRNYKEPQWLRQGTLHDLEEPHSVKSKNHFSCYKLELTQKNNSERIKISKNLALKIEESAEMFAQLEYLARGTDCRDVKDGHIKIISQYLRCCNALWNSIHGSYSLLQVTETMPLFHLASIASHLYNKNRGYFLIAVTHQTMEHICRYFVHLCHDVGFNIEIIKLSEPGLSENISFPADGGCTGVVTEWSDLESAVDTFIHSSKTAPWRLDQIYVQESVYEDFRKALLARAPQSADSIVVGDKTFLFECLQKGSGIPVDAYRTTKELLSLLKTPFLSLWAADSALSNEVALSCSASTVWVNDYASFDGPPRAALSIISAPSNDITKLDVDKASRIKLWSKMEASQRLEVIISAVEASDTASVRALLPALTSHWRSDDFVHFSESSICFGIQKPIGVIKSDHVNETQLLVAIKALVNGNAIFVEHVSTNESFVKELFKRGVPIDSGEMPQNFGYPWVMEKLKVIRTHHGTIFAN